MMEVHIIVMSHWSWMAQPRLMYYKLSKPSRICHKVQVPFVIMGGLVEDKRLPQVQLLTEKAIYDAVLKMIQSAKVMKHLDIAMFYLSERNIIEALKQAKQRGVNIRIMLDPNKDAFGRQRMVFQIASGFRTEMR